MLYLTSETSKSAGVKKGRIKADDSSEKKPQIFLKKKKKSQNTDSSLSFLDELGINASQFTASRLHTGPI